MKISNNGIDPYQKVNLTDLSASNKVVHQENHISSLEANSAQDTVTLSENAKYQNIAFYEAQNAPDVRSQKVARLKEKVANGTYTFNSMDTARAIVRDIFADSSLFMN